VELAVDENELGGVGIGIVSGFGHGRSVKGFRRDARGRA
jgi:hypothetical protein